MDLRQSLVERIYIDWKSLKYPQVRKSLQKFNLSPTIEISAEIVERFCYSSDHKYLFKTDNGPQLKHPIP